jgi:hypothetical protein
MMFFYFLKIIFDISTSKRSKKYKPHSILAKKNKKKFKFSQNTGRNALPNATLTKERGKLPCYINSLSRSLSPHTHAILHSSLLLRAENSDTLFTRYRYYYILDSLSCSKSNFFAGNPSNCEHFLPHLCKVRLKIHVFLC